MKKNDKKPERMKSLNVDYFKYRTKLTAKYEKRKAYEAKNPKFIQAFIPGTVRKISVKEGDRVKKGDLLLILEAMKMKNRILSPVDGIIRKVNVKSGIIVPKNEILMELE